MAVATPVPGMDASKLGSGWGEPGRGVGHGAGLSPGGSLVPAPEGSWRWQVREAVWELSATAWLIQQDGKLHLLESLGLASGKHQPWGGTRDGQAEACGAVPAWGWVQCGGALTELPVSPHGSHHPPPLPGKSSGCIQPWAPSGCLHCCPPDCALGVLPAIHRTHPAWVPGARHLCPVAPAAVGVLEPHACGSCGVTALCPAALWQPGLCGTEGSGWDGPG